MPANYDDARKRSVDNLQRLYTFVVSLAFTESLRRTLLSPAGTAELAWSNKWVMFLSLVFTVIPFYHGANRYLDATYVTNERRPRRYSLMVDFLFLFFQGLLLFTLALLITNDASQSVANDELFFYGLAALLLVDVVWVSISRFVTEEIPPAGKSAYPAWAFINVFAIAVILLFAWRGWWDWMVVVTLVRSAVDYLAAHDFYYPPITAGAAAGGAGAATGGEAR